MTLYTDEITRLLAIAAGYDNRRPGELNTAAWHDASHRGRWTFEEAAEAVKEHYANKVEFVMPAHVTEIIRTHRRRAEAERQQREMLEAPRNPKSFKHLFQDAIIESKRMSMWRRDLVLHYPDLAERLTEPPIGLERPHDWKGWLPPARDQHGNANTSPRAMALAALVAEAQRRAKAEQDGTEGAGQ